MVERGERVPRERPSDTCRHADMSAVTVRRPAGTIMGLRVLAVHTLTDYCNDITGI